MVGPILGQTSYDVEYAQVCLIDSIAPDTLVQFWRFTQANNPGEYTVDITFDMGSAYVVEGTVLPCCSCLTEATAMNGIGGSGGLGDIAAANPPPINALLILSGAVVFALIIPRRKILALFALLASPIAVGAQPGTTYDIEHTCICLVDSIAADIVIQFWRFTQSNNPGEYTVDVTYDMGSAYVVAGTVLSCKDYYLGDNPGGSGTANTLAMWTGTSSLGNSSVTQSGQVLSSSFTGSFKPPAGTTAQQPAGSPGYFRFNTTASGLEGYNGSAYRFLPWADADNWAIKSVPFSDGNQLTSDIADLLYDSATDQFSAQYIKAGDALTSSGAGILDVRGVRGDHTVFVSGTGTTTFNSSMYMTAADVNSWLAFFVSTPLTTKPTLFLGETNSAEQTSVKHAIQIGPYNSTNGAGGFQVGNGGGRSIHWDYTRAIGPAAQAAYNFSAGRIVPVVVNNHYGNMDTELRFYATKANTLTAIMGLDSAGMKLPLYGAGTLTGTPAYSVSVNSSGRLIEVPEKWASVSTSTDGSGDITVTHGVGTTPTVVMTSVTGTTPYFITVTAKGATTFTVRFFAAATGLAVASTAVTFDWLAKT